MEFPRESYESNFFRLEDDNLPLILDTQIRREVGVSSYLRRAYIHTHARAYAHLHYAFLIAMRSTRVGKSFEQFQLISSPFSAPPSLAVDRVIRGRREML